MEVRILGTEASDTLSGIKSVRLLGEEGEMTILEGHMHLYASLKDGLLKAKAKSGHRLTFLLTQAVALVSNKRVVVCSDLVEKVEEGRICDLETKLKLCKKMLESEGNTFIARWERRLGAYQLFNKHNNA